LIRLQTWPSQAVLVSDWSISKKSSPLKPHKQMNRNLVGGIFPTKFQFIWLSSSRVEDVLEIDQSETRIACGGHFC
jgi:hypothetical protein